MRFCNLAAAGVMTFAALALSQAAEPAAIEYRVLATSKTSTMEKEMNLAAEAGFRFSAVMGGETSVGGGEGVVVMSKLASGLQTGSTAYKLLATSKTSTMQKEMQLLGDDGFDYRGQTVFKTALGGEEVVVIMERPAGPEPAKIQYALLATAKTSTMQKELRSAGAAGFTLVGFTVSKTAFGGSELVSIMKK
jgi:hypothetical protein